MTVRVLAERLLFPLLSWGNHKYRRRMH